MKELLQHASAPPGWGAALRYIVVLREPLSASLSWYSPIPGNTDTL